MWMIDARLLYPLGLKHKIR